MAPPSSCPRVSRGTLRPAEVFRKFIELIQKTSKSDWINYVLMCALHDKTLEALVRKRDPIGRVESRPERDAGYWREVRQCADDFKVRN